MQNLLCTIVIGGRSARLNKTDGVKNPGGGDNACNTFGSLAIFLSQSFLVRLKSCLATEVHVISYLS